MIAELDLAQGGRYIEGLRDPESLGHRAEEIGPAGDAHGGQHGAIVLVGVRQKVHQ
jgi:hypothetical protein